MNMILGLLFFIVGAMTFAVLVRYGRTEDIDLMGWIGATLCTVGGLMTMIGYAFDVGIGISGDNARQIATFVSVLFTLCALTFGVVWWLKRNRPQSAAQPEAAPTPKAYVHPYGTYNASTVRDARAQAQQIRRGARE